MPPQVSAHHLSGSNVIVFVCVANLIRIRFTRVSDSGMRVVATLPAAFLNKENSAVPHCYSPKITRSSLDCEPQGRTCGTSPSSIMQTIQEI